MKKKEEWMGKIKNYKYLEESISLGICCLAMLLFCFGSMLQFEEASTFITGDVLELYIPGVRSFARNLRAGQRIDFSWDLFMGMNATAYYTAVVGGSLINLLYIAFPQINPELFVVISIVVKGGLAGAFFVTFSKRILNVDGITAVFFSLFYALCGSQVAINCVNFIWMDTVYLLPLLLVFLVSFWEEGKWKRLVLAYAYLFICNFYIAYIVGIFSACFFCLYILVFARFDIKKIFFYAFCVVLAAGLVAFALIPTAVFMLENFTPSIPASDGDLIQKDILLLLSRFFIGKEWTSDVRFPYLYSGIPVLMLLPFYFLNKEIDKKEKILYGSLTLLMLLSCILTPLYLFWHGFDAPDGWSFRFSFIISFLLVCMGCKQAKYLWNENRKRFFFVSFSEVFIATGIMVYCGWKTGESHIITDAVQIILMLIWTLFVVFCLRPQEKYFKMWLVLGMVLAFAETVWNGYQEHEIYQDQQEMEIWLQETASAMELLEKDSDFYRIHYENSLMVNADTYWGYHGISDFSSFENKKVRAAIRNMGGYTSERVIYGYGFNPFLQLLLDVKYKIRASGSQEAETAGAVVLAYPNTLGLGFLVEEDVQKFSLEDEHVFDNINQLASCMTGQQLQIFSMVPTEWVSIEENGIRLLEKDGYYAIMKAEETQGSIWLNYVVPYQGKDAYIVFNGNNWGILPYKPIIFEYDNERENRNFGVRHTKKMDFRDTTQICTVVMEPGVTDEYITYTEAEIYYLEADALENFYQSLKDGCMEVVEYDNGFLHGKITVPEKEKILFTSIPYDKGWTVKTNHGDAEIIPLLDGAFLGVKFQEYGDHDLIFTYEAAGVKSGMKIFFGAALIFAVMSGIDLVHKKRKNGLYA